MTFSASIRAKLATKTASARQTSARRAIFNCKDCQGENVWCNSIQWRAKPRMNCEHPLLCGLYIEYGGQLQAPNEEETH